MNLPDFKTMDEEQKKKFILVAILGVGALYALANFLVTPFLEEGKRTAVELSTLEDKVDRAQLALNREAEIRSNSQKTGEEIKNISTEFVPPVQNALSWVAGRVYSSARKVGLEIESVNDLGVPSVPWTRGEETEKAFVPYTVRIVTQCGYNELASLVCALEKDNPYLCVSAIEISAQSLTPEKHRVQLSVEWPFWIDPVEGASFTGEQEVQNG